MKRTLMIIAFLVLGGWPVARADETMRAVQQALKDQGFYYGELTGEKNSDTTAAIRRFQIRNGLQITGETSAETLRSLGVGSNSSPAPARRPATAPAPEASDLQDNEATTRTERIAPPPAEAYHPQRELPPRGYAPGPHGLQPEMSGVFDGTPYEVAPPELQQRVVVGAQTLLARRGFYRSSIDGVFGPGTAVAVREFQLRFGLSPNGRLDMETLAVLGLLPGQHAPGVAVPPRRADRKGQPRALPYEGRPVPY